MNDRIVLNVRPSSNADAIDVTAKNRPEPNAAFAPRVTSPMTTAPCAIKALAGTLGDWPQNLKKAILKIHDQRFSCIQAAIDCADGGNVHEGLCQRVIETDSGHRLSGVAPSRISASGTSPRKECPFHRIRRGHRCSNSSMRSPLIAS